MPGHATWHVAADDPSTIGHFPGNPIVPGAVLLREIVAAIAARHPGEICRRIGAAKFLHPVRPGDNLRIEWERTEDGEIRFLCMIAPEGPRAVIGALRLGPA